VDVYVKPVDVFQPTLRTWAVRYVGWYVPFSTPRNCGHRHESEELAQKCAQMLLFKVRKDGHWTASEGPPGPTTEKERN